MSKFLLPVLTIVIVSCTVSVSVDGDDDIDEIMQVLERQTTCWNSGDLECFMIGYWESDSLMFIGGNGIIYGYDNTLARYKRAYPDRQAMGTLNFNILEMNPVEDNGYFVVGQYYLRRDSTVGDASGHFSLLWKKIDDDWVIVADHSSAGSAD